MKAILLLGLGLLPGCCGLKKNHVSPGTYLSSGDAGATDYQLTVSADKHTVEERFVRDGKQYVITYDVTAAMEQ